MDSSGAYPKSSVDARVAFLKQPPLFHCSGKKTQSSSSILLKFLRILQDLYASFQWVFSLTIEVHTTFNLLRAHTSTSIIEDLSLIMSSSSIPFDLLRTESCNSVAQKFNSFTQDSTSFLLTILKKCLFHQKDRRSKILHLFMSLINNFTILLLPPMVTITEIS